MGGDGCDRPRQCFHMFLHPFFHFLPGFFKRVDLCSGFGVRELSRILQHIERVAINESEFGRATHPLGVVSILAAVNIDGKNLNFGLFRNGECTMFEIHELCARRLHKTQ